MWCVHCLWSFKLCLYLQEIIMPTSLPGQLCYRLYRQLLEHWQTSGGLGKLVPKHTFQKTSQRKPGSETRALLSAWPFFILTGLKKCAGTHSQSGDFQWWTRFSEPVRFHTRRRERMPCRPSCTWSPQQGSLRRPSWFPFAWLPPSSSDICVQDRHLNTPQKVPGICVTVSLHNH